MGSHRGIVLDDPLAELRLVAALLAIGIAGVHLFHPRLGALRLLEFIRLGTIFNPLPILFTLLAVAIVFGIVLVYHGLYARLVYLVGIGLMLGLVVGYIAWHTVLDHGAFWPHIEAHTHAERGPIELLVVHARDDVVGLTSKILELALAAILAVLYVLEPPRSH